MYVRSTECLGSNVVSCLGPYVYALLETIKKISLLATLLFLIQVDVEIIL